MYRYRTIVLYHVVLKNHRTLCIVPSYLRTYRITLLLYIIVQCTIFFESKEFSYEFLIHFLDVLQYVRMLLRFICKAEVRDVCYFEFHSMPLQFNDSIILRYRTVRIITYSSRAFLKFCKFSFLNSQARYHTVRYDTVRCPF